MYLQDYVKQKNLKYVTVYKFLDRNYSEKLSKKNGKIWLSKKLMSILDNKFNPVIDVKLSKFSNKMKVYDDCISQLQDTLSDLSLYKKKSANIINQLLEENANVKERIKGFKSVIEWQDTMIERIADNNNSLETTNKKLFQEIDFLKNKIAVIEQVLEQESNKSVFKKLMKK